MPKARGIVPASGARTVAAGARRFGRGFTVAQIALALVLLTLSAGVLESLYRLLSTPLGFNPGELQTFSVDLPWTSEIQSRHRFYQRGRLPGGHAGGDWRGSDQRASPVGV